MRKIKHWLIDKILPIWAKQELLRENKQLLCKIAELQAKLNEQNAYIEGLETGIRSQRKIVINAMEANK